MIEISAHSGEGFRVLKEYGDWKVGMLRYNERFSRFSELERHLETDEVFLLLEGSAVLHTDTESIELETGVLYTVPVGVWHHVVVSTDASVLVVENRSTSKENTEKKYLCGQEER